MKFDDLQEKMRVFETAHDHCVLPGLTMIARLDGRGFTKLTKEAHPFEKPFDLRFRDIMIETAKHLFHCGFSILYGYIQSDEISLLLHPQDQLFNRKLRKINSILAGEASAKFSLLLGDMGVFDCRIAQIPSPNLVADYFRWRQEDAHRNSLTGHCYWTLREGGLDRSQASQLLLKLPASSKNELLFRRGKNFNDFPAWQKRGVGLVWETYEKEAINPKTGEKVTAIRRRLGLLEELPVRDAYGEMIQNLLAQASASSTTAS